MMIKVSLTTSGRSSSVSPRRTESKLVKLSNPPNLNKYDYILLMFYLKQFKFSLYTYQKALMNISHQLFDYKITFVNSQHKKKQVLLFFKYEYKSFDYKNCKM